MQNVIEVKNLTKKFKDFTAVNNLDLNVYRGDIFGFLGPNGAGKSTTIRMLTTLINPTSGTINIFDKPLKEKRNDILKKVGAIVEKPDFYGYLSAYKNLEILGQISGCDTSSKSLMEILETVGLEKRAKSKVKTFSHGMKQRLGLAQALIHNPELIILDEPTTGLDPQGMKEIRELIIHLAKEMNKTIFLSSHILAEVELVANRMIIINKGKTVVEGTVQDLLNATNLKVTFEINELENAKNILAETQWQKKIESFGDYQILFLLEKNEIAPLNKFFVENGIPVHAIVPKRSLEEYFLNLTEKGN